MLQRSRSKPAGSTSVAAMRLAQVFGLLAVLLACACAGTEVSYDFTELDERNLLRGEPD
jgi:hypothetical protein